MPPAVNHHSDRILQIIQARADEVKHHSAKKQIRDNIGDLAQALKLVNGTKTVTQAKAIMARRLKYTPDATMQRSETFLKQGDLKAILDAIHEQGLAPSSVLGASTKLSTDALMGQLMLCLMAAPPRASASVPSCEAPTTMITPASPTLEDMSATAFNALYDLAGLAYPLNKIRDYCATSSDTDCTWEAHAVLYVTAVMEYLAVDLLELSGNVARDCSKSCISVAHIEQAVSNDDELRTLMATPSLVPHAVCTNMEPVYNILKSVHPDTGISKRALKHVDRLIMSVGRTIVKRAAETAARITVNRVSDVTRRLLGDELAKYAEFEACRAVIKAASA